MLGNWIFFKEHGFWDSLNLEKCQLFYLGTYLLDSPFSYLQNGDFYVKSLSVY